MPPRMPNPYLLIMCEGSADVPYMRALCAYMRTSPKLSFPYSPRIDHANGGSQWRVAQAAASKLKQIGDKNSRSLVLIDADRGALSSSEKEKAQYTVQKLPTRFGKVEILFVEPCFEGFILSLCGQQIANLNSQTCKKRLAVQCAQIGANAMFHQTLVSLFQKSTFRDDNNTLNHILEWLKKPLVNNAAFSIPILTL